MEAVVSQILPLFATLAGSYFFGQQASKELMKEMFKLHARSAFRRLISLYRSISCVAHIIAGEEVAHIIAGEENDNAKKIGIINAIVIEQIATANDAMADWQDVVPELVEELKANACN